MTETEAIRRAQMLLKASNSGRAAMEAMTALQLAYAYGSQWASIGRGRAHGHQLRGLRTAMDPDNPQIRVCMNNIEQKIAKILSRLKPDKIDFRVHSESKAPNDRMAAIVGEKRLGVHLAGARALTQLRKKDVYRAVLGSVVVRRCLSQNGNPLVLRDEAGEPKLDENGRPLMLRTFAHDWAACPPHEFMRDPAVMGPQFEEDECIGHEKPRSVDWLKRNFGVNVETETTMGSILSFQRSLHQLTGHSLDDGWRDSETKAVLVSEYWFKGDGREPETKWPQYLLAYRDVGKTGDDYQGLQKLWFSKNPYHGLPLHHYWYKERLFCPWGVGIPILLMQSQDILNNGWTAMMRQVIWHGSAKWLVQDESLVDDPRKALNNQPNRPIVVNRNTTHLPQRIPGGQIDQNAMALIQNSPEWMDRMLNMSPVQSGEAVKRGESKEAYQYRYEAADTPILDRLKDDELATNELLTGTLLDLVKTDTLQVLHETLSHEFDERQIRALKAQDMEASNVGVFVKPDSLRAKKPQEVREDIAQGLQSNMVDPVTARRSLLVRTGVGLDVREQAAYEKQIGELQALLNGQFVQVYDGQDHATHMYTLELEMESPHWDALSEEQRMSVSGHLELHKQTQMEAEMEAQAMSQGMMPPEGGMPPMGGEPAAGPATSEPPSLPAEAGQLQGVA